MQSVFRPRSFQEVEATRLKLKRHMWVLRSSALRKARLYARGNIPGTHFCYWLGRPQGHSTAGRIVVMENSNDTIGNWIRDLPACSAMPRPTAPPHARADYNNLDILLQENPGLLNEETFHIVLCFVSVLMCIFLRLEREFRNVNVVLKRIMLEYKP
jgi:hypothetical protein